MDFFSRYQSMIFNYGAFFVNAFAIMWNVTGALPDSTLIIGLMGILAAQSTGVYGIKKTADVKTAQATGEAGAN